MNTISMPQLCDTHAAMTSALPFSAKLLADARGGFGATGGFVAGSVVSGCVVRERHIGTIAPVMGEVSDWLVERDVPMYVNSKFAGGARRSVSSRPPV